MLPFQLKRTGAWVAIIAVTFCASAAVADVPHKMSYQGRLTDSLDNPIDTVVDLDFGIYNSPQAIAPAWSETQSAVTVADGLFSVMLGSETPLPAEIFDGSTKYLAVAFVGHLITAPRMQINSAAYAYRSINADTAAYALASPGGGGEGGWVDEGSVVHTISSNDNVGIGTSSPTDKLVVGGNLGTSIDDNYIVVRNGNNTYSGYRLGYSNDNYGWMNWYSYDGCMDFGTRQTSTNYLHTLVLTNGNVGIGQVAPSEKLVVGDDLGSFDGNRIAVGDHAPANYAGIMMGEDSDNRAFLTWSVDNNYFDIGIEDEGTQWSQMIKLEDGEVKVGIGSGNSSVQLPTDAVSSQEILNEPGIARVGQSSAVNLGNDWTLICQKTCDFPTSGYAVVLVTADLFYVINDANAHFGITRNGGEAPYTYFFQQDVNELNAWSSATPINLHEVFTVDAGADLFQFVGVASVGTPNTGNVSMTIMFFPTQYTAKDASESGIIPDETTQPLLYTSHDVPAQGESGVSEASTRTSIDAKLDALEAENADLRRRLDALEAAVGK